MLTHFLDLLAVVISVNKPFDCHIRSVDRYYFFFEE